MRVLALVPGSISEQILFFPTLDDLKQSYPGATIDVVIEPRAKAAYRLCQAVNQTISFDFQDRNSPSDWANLLGIIRDDYYEVAFSLGSQWRLGLLLWLAGIPTRVGYAGTAGKLFLTQSVALKTEQYVAHQYHDLLQGLNIATPCPDLAITIPKADLDWAEAERQRLGVQTSGYVLMHNGSGPAQAIAAAYPGQCWQQIVQDFQNRQPDLPIVLISGPDDGTWSGDLSPACPGLKASTPSNLGQLAAMIAGANLMLCPDSAAMHLAVALKVYTLALFGVTDPKKQLPSSDRFIGIQSPTGKLADIPPETVLAKVWGE
ncbi:MAG: glycosyltransferase family 9 protein [Cyanothece sp. SIO1E1]|nr:glycosyltransferase family 9 protein [Cyanothece sp. SIO1E1]